jgi:uncharacterized protein (DUF305 family)
MAATSARFGVGAFALAALLAAPRLAPALAPPALAQADPHAGHLHAAHAHDLGPAGSSYDLRFIDAMVQHYTGALRMGDYVVGIGEPGVGALAKTIWRDQADEIRAMGLWRKAWYPEAPVYPLALAPGADPNSLAALSRMGQAQIEAVRMLGAQPTILRFARGVIVAQRAEIIQLGKMLALQGLRKGDYYQYDALVVL